MMIAAFLLLISTPVANLSVGDAAFARIDYTSAINAYEEQLPAYPHDADLLWRLARVFVCAGEVMAKEEGEAYFIQAAEYARRSIRADSTKSESHTWLAAALGYLALNAGITEQVRLTNELHDEITIALALNPKDDAAYSIRGSLFRALANVSWLQRQVATVFIGSLPNGDFEESELALKKAIALAPTVMRHHYELGVLYMDWGKLNEARIALKAALQLPVRVAIDVPRRAKARQLLDTLNESGE